MTEIKTKRKEQHGSKRHIKGYTDGPVSPPSDGFLSLFNYYWVQKPKKPAVVVSFNYSN